MSQFSLYTVSSVLLFCIGLYGLIVHAHLVRKILAVNIIGNGIFLLLVNAAQRSPQAGPDPVPHAMVLTGIVVTVSATAYALVLTRRVFAETGQACLPKAGGAAPSDEVNKQNQEPVSSS